MKSISSHNKSLLNRIRRYSVFGAIIIGVGFAVTRFMPMVRGPVLSTNLTDGITLQDSRLHISGQAHNGSETLLNGAPLTVTTDGIFTTDLILGSGTNSLTITAKDRFGKETSKTYTLVLHEQVGTPSLAVSTDTGHNY